MKRYNAMLVDCISQCNVAYSVIKFEENSHGDYVLFEDAEKEIQALKTEMEAWKENSKNLLELMLQIKVMDTGTELSSVKFPDVPKELPINIMPVCVYGVKIGE